VFVRGVADAPGRLVTELGELMATLPDGVRPGEPVDVLLRPDDIVHDDASPWHAAVQSKTFRGAEFLYTLSLASGTRILAVVPSHHDHAIGEGIGIRLAIDHVVAFAAARGTAA
jgi:iron(III) transport system ATP-binding protein